MAALHLLCLATAIAFCSGAAINNPYVTDEIIDKDVAGTNFKLYTKSNPDTGVVITAENLESIKIFVASRETRIVVHGWKNSAGDLEEIRQAYVNSGGDYNIVMVDWAVGASNNVYCGALNKLEVVGETLAELIEAMVKMGASTSRMQIAGHSLGAHIAGIASRKAGKVARVIGLDPAGPFFKCVAESSRLDKGVAHFVEVIHTDAGQYGWKGDLGHADFYPNGGSALQPGCFSLNPLTAGCSHGRAKQFFAESINSAAGFWALKCDSWNSFKKGSCKSNSQEIMGEKTPDSVSGSYYLTTGKSSPFAKGQAGANPIVELK